MAIFADRESQRDLAAMLRWFRSRQGPGRDSEITIDGGGYPAGGFGRKDADRRNGSRVFPVWVTQSGGSAGTSSAECSFTYNVFTDSAKTIQIGTTVALQKNRLLNCAMTAGTLGLAYYEDGTLKLWDVNERMTQATCDPA